MKSSVRNCHEKGFFAKVGSRIDRREKHIIFRSIHAVVTLFSVGSNS
jgi:hypothetical protein